MVRGENTSGNVIGHLGLQPQGILRLTSKLSLILAEEILLNLACTNCVDNGLGFPLTVYLRFNLKSVAMAADIIHSQNVIVNSLNRECSIVIIPGGGHHISTLTRLG
ncbi:hypothetical protein AN958_08090 [Leucoagaricus sp. SymC.cos]|nr:hypothetical protein AN958_08090 [Leucoagaricus sp. SymC.cos]